MEEIITYRAKDGMIFDSKDDCIAHEKTTDLLIAATTIKDFCSSLSGCGDCIFLRSTGECCLVDTDRAPAYWKIKECE